MSKYQITRACGHAETVNIGGKVSERDRLAGYEERKMCYECYKAKQAADRAAATEAASADAQTKNLPDLQGSDKQIAWAETIRASMLKMADYLPRFDALEAAGTIDPVQAATKRMILRVQACNSAKWYIDNREAVGATAMDTLRGLLGDTRGLSVEQALAKVDDICA